MNILGFLGEFRGDVEDSMRTIEEEGHSLKIVSPLSELDVIFAHLKGADVAISVNEVWTERWFQEAPNLKLIARFGVGYDNVPIEVARAHGVTVSNAPGVNSNAVAEITVALIIAMMRRLSDLERIVAAGGWSRIFGEELQGKTVGLVGFGNVAQEVAGKLSGFGVKVLASDPYANAEAAASMGVQLVEVEALRETADVISLHVPGTGTTEGMVDHNFLAAMKRGSYLVNTCRGSVVVEQALAEAVNSGHLAGAATDVYAQEPPSLESPLVGNPKIIALPHAAGLTSQVVERTTRVTLEAIRSVARGEQPMFTVS